MMVNTDKLILLAKSWKEEADQLGRALSNPAVFPSDLAYIAIKRNILSENARALENILDKA